MTKKIVALVAKSIEANNALLESLNEYLAEEAVTEKTVAKASTKKAPAKKVVEEVEEAPAKKAPASKKAPATKKAPAKKVVEVEEEEEEEAVEGELPEGFDTMKLPELKAFAKENGIRIPKDTKIADVRDLIREGLGLEEEAEEEVEEEEEVEAEMSENTITYEDEEEGEVTIDLEDYDVKGLKQLAKEFDLKVPVKLKTKPSIIAFLMEAFEEEAEEEDVEDVEADEEVEEEENPEVAYGLDEMSTEELADLLREHELKATGKRSQLVARIIEAIEDGTIETEEEGE